MRTFFLLALFASIHPFIKSQGTLLIKSGFEENIQVESLKGGSIFTGTDSKTGFSWDAHGLPGTLKFFYLSGDSPDEYVSTRIDDVTGHLTTPSRALYMEVKKDFKDKFGKVSRNEFSFFTDSAFSEGYVSYWMKLQDNLLDMAPRTSESDQLDYYQLDSWRMLMELKEPNSGVSIKGRGTNNYRISFFIARDPESNTMYWLLRGEMPQPVRAIDWSVENKTVPVPVGEWFKMEAYYKKGRENGRVWWAVNGEVIADYVGRTEHPDNPLPIKFWSFIKLYQDEKWFEKGPVYQWVDDLEYWSSFPPGHKVLDPEQHQILYRDNFQKEQDLKNSGKQPGQAIEKIILDTDMGSDCDDVGALALLHQYAIEGKAEILGVIYSSGAVPYGAGVVDAINRYFGKPDIPIGASYDEGFGDPVDKMLAEKLATDTAAFGNRIIHNSDAEEQTALNRRLLAKAADHSVTYITIGHTRGLYDLLTSQADRISALNGVELVNRKIKRWVALGALGAANEDGHLTKDWNFFFNESAVYTNYLVEKFPGPVYFVDGGGNVKTGKSLNQTPEGNILRTAYESWLWNVEQKQLKDQRSSWDLVTVLYAVEGPDQYFDKMGPGYLEFIPEEGCRWVLSDNPTTHHFLRQKQGSDEALSSYLNEMISQYEPNENND